MLEPGARIGPYEVISPLGAGGMGQVWRAHDSRLRRDVAVKVLPAEFASDPERLQRFEREARATAALSHPNILAVFDIGSHDGEPYIVEELVEGESLRTVLGGARLPLETTVDLATQIARGLAAAHDKRIVHRDLKPDNVIVTTDGQAKILDFGIAKFVAAAPSESAETLTHVPTGATELGAVLGTAAYMAPEQALGRPVDQRVDVFAFGVVLYEMLCGQRPFHGATGTEIVAAILKDTPSRLPESVPEYLRQLVDRCLKKTPEERPASARDVLDALRSQVVTQIPVPGAGAAGARSRRPATRIAGLAVAGVALVAGGIAAWRGGWLRAGPGEPLDPAKVMVTPFENLTGIPSLDAVSRLTADAISQGLVEVGGLGVVAAPTGSAGSGEAALRVAALKAATGTVITGSLYLTGGVIDLRGRIVDTARGQPIFVLKPEQALREKVSEAIDRVRQRAMGAILLHLERAPGLGGQTSPPLYAAYQECLAAERLMGLDWPAVVAHLERAVELDPDFWHPKVRLISPYRIVGNRAAAEALRKQLEENQDKLCPADRILLACVDAKASGRRLEAYRRSHELLALAPRDPVVVYSHASLALELYYPRDALAALGRLSDAQWEQLVGWTQGTWLLGQAAFAHHLLGEHEAELAVAEKAVRLYGDMLNVRQDQVRALAALGRLGDVDRVVAECLAVRARSDTPGEVMLTGAQELRAHGHPEAARSIASRGADWYASQTGDEARASTLNRVECLWLAGRLKEARAAVDAAFALGPEDIFTKGYRGIVAAQAGDSAVAAAMDRDLAGQDDVRRRGNCSWMRACIAAQRGERDKALELLRVALAHGSTAQGYLHVYAFLEPLHGWAPFEELITPKG